MGRNSGIAWCDHTMNPWHGCTKVSPACDACYAEAFDARFHGSEGQPPAHWGKDAPRRYFGEKHWNEPLKWNRDAQLAGKPAFVFCASMADVFEAYHPNGSKDDPLDAWRLKLWALITKTPWLVWLLLTKRPQNIGRMAPPEIRSARNVWFGTTIESPDYLWRADKLIEHAPESPVRFLSMEPLIAEVSLVDIWETRGEASPAIDWVITGCESGHGARPTPTDWYRYIRNECSAYAVPYFFKQGQQGAEGIASGPGSWLKLKDKIIELPYLDGVQHAARPTPHP